MITVFGNLKGGTGKSTVALNVAAFLAVNGKSSRLFDIDPQGTLSDLVDIRREEGHRPAIAVQHQVAKLHTTVSSEVLVDVGTSDMPSLRYAISVADRIVTPVPPSQPDVWALQRFIAIVREGSLGRAMPPQHLCFINRADAGSDFADNRQARAALESLRSVRFLDATWCDRKVYRQSLSEGLAAFELDPEGGAAAEVTRLCMILYSHLFVS